MGALHTIADDGIHYDITKEDGTQVWYRNNDIHRIGGPAIIFASGTCIWMQDDQPHRIDGPAEIYKAGPRCWSLKGRYYHSNKEFQVSAGLTDEEMSMMILKYGNVT
jgi:hypothetical protein